MVCKWRSIIAYKSWEPILQVENGHQALYPLLVCLVGDFLTASRDPWEENHHEKPPFGEILHFFQPP